MMKRIIAAICTLGVMMTGINAFAEGMYKTVKLPGGYSGDFNVEDGYIYFGKYGVMKETGEEITYGKYKINGTVYYGERFKDGYLRVYDKDTDLCGIIDESGKLVIDTKYKKFGDFNENGLAVAMGSNELFGMVDKSGETVIPFIFCELKTFGKDGMAIAAVYLEGEKKYGVINEKGETIIPFIYDGLMRTDIDGVLKSVKIQINEYGRTYEKYGLVKTDGSVILPPEYINIGKFNELGLAIIRTTDRKAGMIDSNGKIVCPCKFLDIVTIYENGMIFASKYIDGSRYAYGFADTYGNELTEFIYRNNRQYIGDGYTLLEKDGGGYEVIDRDYNEIFKDKYDCVYYSGGKLVLLEDGNSSSNGKLIVSKDGKKGLAEKDGTVILPLIYDDVLLHAVKKGEYWAFLIDGKEGEYKYTEIYERAEYEYGFGTKEDGNVDMVNLKTGEVIYDNIVKEGYSYYVTLDGKEYEITIRGEIFIKSGCVRVGSFTDGVAPAMNADKKWGLINEDYEAITEFNIEPTIYIAGVRQRAAIYEIYNYRFSDGLMAVCIDGKLGYMNTKGEIVIEPQFAPSMGCYIENYLNYGDFRHGYAAVIKDGKLCFIDKEGNIAQNVKAESNRLEDYLLIEADKATLWQNDEVIMYAENGKLCDKDGNVIKENIVTDENGMIRIALYDDGLEVCTADGQWIVMYSS